ncbi:UNVERIFIED_CONTAM: hypothetical protein K2H54_057992 [Gekko kuhli]
MLYFLHLGDSLVGFVQFESTGGNRCGSTNGRRSKTGSCIVAAREHRLCSSLSPLVIIAPALPRLPFSASSPPQRRNKMPNREKTTSSDSNASQNTDRNPKRAKECEDSLAGNVPNLYPPDLPLWHQTPKDNLGGRAPVPDVFPYTLLLNVPSDVLPHHCLHNYTLSCTLTQGPSDRPPLRGGRSCCHIAVLWSIAQMMKSLATARGLHGLAPSSMVETMETHLQLAECLLNDHAYLAMRLLLPA